MNPSRCLRNGEVISRYNWCNSANRNASSAAQRWLSSSAHLKQKASTRVIFSGIQPTGVPHLGNYLGALRQWKEIQDESDQPNTLYSLVDLHAITIRQDAAQLRRWRQESLAMLLAIGLEPSRTTIFFQSDVPAHSELMWILSCQASTGYLGRMTQWKDKTSNSRDSSNNSEKAKLGLFSYPVLMAADVLVHGTTHVPVGHDQSQHLEFARELAAGFNHATGGTTVLHPPETLISPAKRIMSLTDPTAKMSKSHANPASRIGMADEEEEIRRKIQGAVTDSENSVSYDPVARPGVSNLVDLLFHSGAEPQFESQLSLVEDMGGLGLGAFKRRVADGLEKVIRPIRERYLEIKDDEARLAEVAEAGAVKARENAAGVMERVRTAVGLS